MLSSVLINSIISQFLLIFPFFRVIYRPFRFPWSITYQNFPNSSSALALQRAPLTRSCLLCPLGGCLIGCSPFRLESNGKGSWLAALSEIANRMQWNALRRQRKEWRAVWKGQRHSINFNLRGSFRSVYVYMYMAWLGICISPPLFHAVDLVSGSRWLADGPVVQVCPLHSAWKPNLLLETESSSRRIFAMMCLLDDLQWPQTALWFMPAAVMS